MTYKYVKKSRMRKIVKKLIEEHGLELLKDFDTVFLVKSGDDEYGFVFIDMEEASEFAEKFRPAFEIYAPERYGREYSLLKLWRR